MMKIILILLRNKHFRFVLDLFLFGISVYGYAIGDICIALMGLSFMIVSVLNNDD